MTNIVTHQTGTGEPHASNHGLAAGELAIKQKATAHTTAASGKLYYGEDVSDLDSTTSTLRTFGIGILAGDDSDQSQTGVPIGGNMYFKEGNNMTIAQSTSGDVVTLTFTPSTSATLTGAGSTIDSEDLTASRALVSNGSGKVAVSAVTATELGYLDGVTSAIQTQLDATVSTSSANVFTAAQKINDDLTLTFGTNDDVTMEYDENGTDTLLITGAVQFADGSTNVNFASHDGTNGLALGGTVVTASAAELNYVDGVTSAIQTQLDAKQASLTFGKSSGNALKSEEALATNDILLMGSSNVKGRTYSQLKADLSLEIGTDVQAWDAQLDTLAAMTSGEIDAFAALSATEIAIIDGLTTTTAELNLLDGTVNATELGYLDGATAGASVASKAMVTDSSGDIYMPDSDKFELGASSDMQLYHDGSNSYIANKTGALKIATETSGIAVSIGHTTSETTVNDNLTVTGTLGVGGTLTATGGITIPAGAPREFSINGEAVTDIKTSNDSASTSDDDLVTAGYINQHVSGGSGYSAGDTIRFADGSNSSPGLALNSDQDTGFYDGGTNILGFAAGGAAQLLLGDGFLKAATDNDINLGDASSNGFASVTSRNYRVYSDDDSSYLDGGGGTATQISAALPDGTACNLILGVAHGITTVVQLEPSGAGSDLKYKENLQDYTNGLSFIDSLPSSRNWDWKDSASEMRPKVFGSTGFGYVAQELESAGLSKYVTTIKSSDWETIDDSIDDYKAVEYVKLEKDILYGLVNAVKELSTKVKALEDA